jgi:hypothetical protein
MSVEAKEIVAVITAFGLMIGLSLLRRWLRKRKLEVTQLKKDVLSNSVHLPTDYGKRTDRR